MKKKLPEVLIICALSICIALAVNAFRVDGLPLFGSGKQNGSTDSDPAFRQMDIQTAITNFEQETALFADARSVNDFKAGHIAGALNLPAQQPEEWLEMIFAEVEPDKTLITYCNGADCPLAKQLARVLTEAGYKQVFYLVDGWGQWTANNMPIEKGE